MPLLPTTSGDHSKLEQDYRAAFEAYRRSPTPENASVILQKLNPVIQTGLRSYGDPNSPILKAKAKAIVLDSLGRYDDRQTKLRTFLLTQLQGLQRFAAQSAQVVRIPERVGLDLHRVRTAEAELRDQLGRDPSDAELSEFAGITARRLKHIRQAAPVTSEGFMSTLSGGDGEEGGMVPTVGSSDHKMWQEFVYRDLDPTDQIIMEHTLGINSKPVLQKKEIAQKLGVTPSAVTLRAQKIKARLDEREELGQGLFG